MNNLKIADRYIGPDKPVFIIAEAGSNHNGSFSQAKKLIDAAKDARVDAVKFQLFRAERLYPKNCGKVSTPMGKIDFFQVLKNAELPSSWLKPLKHYAEEKGLIFLCTCFDEASADKLQKAGICAYKLGAAELNHIPLLEHIAGQNKPIILSTGLSMLADIEEALAVCSRGGNGKIALLHCVSAYPAPLKECNLNLIQVLSLAFGLPVGFSDHSLGAYPAPQIAVAAGACIIEKHFTLSRSLPGPDHSFALEPKELSQMVKTIRVLERRSNKLAYVKSVFGKDKLRLALGSFKKSITASERPIYPNDKRSIHAVTDIRKGSLLNRRNIMVLRSERNLKPGMHPRFYRLLLGKRTSRNIKYGQGINWGDILNR